METSFLYSHFQVGNMATHSLLLSFVVISIKVNRLPLLTLFLRENRHVLSSGKCNQIKWSSFNQLRVILVAISVFELIGFVIAPHTQTNSDRHRSTTGNSFLHTQSNCFLNRMFLHLNDLSNAFLFSNSILRFILPSFQHILYST